MAIRTSLQPRHLYLKPLYAVVLLGLALWGWYDYSVKIPRQQAAFDLYETLSARRKELTDKAAPPGKISTDELREYEEINARLNQEFKEPPTPVAAYDAPVQLWLYIVGCGILGVPSVVWPLMRMWRKRYELDDDGTMRFPEGTYRMEDVQSIDMSNWMKKSIATVTFTDGKSAKLDDYEYKNLHLIIGAIAHRLHPDEWTSEAKIIKPDEESDGVVDEIEDTSNSHSTSIEDER